MTSRGTFRVGFVLLAAAVSAVTAAPAAADHLQLKDGRVFTDVAMKKEGDTIVVAFEHGAVKVPLERVDDYFIEGVAPFEPRTPKEKEMRDKGLVPFRGKWIKPEARFKAIAKEQDARKAALEEHRKHQVWRNRYKFATKHFEFESTLTPKLNEYYSGLMEAYFKEFSKSWKIKVPKDWGKLKVCFYHDREAFHRGSGASGGVLAYYRFVPPRELHFYYDRKQPENTTWTMFHEANHYLTDLMDERFQYAHWINEAMAEYYGATVYDPKTKKLAVGNIQHGRLTEVWADMAGEKPYPLIDLIGSEERDYRHYYWGWSFVHFMLESPKYEKKFKKFFAQMARGKKVKRVPGSFNFKAASGDEYRRQFMRIVGVDDIAALEKDWLAHVNAMDVSELRGLEEAGVSAYQQGRPMRAHRLLGQAVEKGSTNMQAHIYYAQSMLAAGEGSPEDALKVLENASEVDSLDADVWARRGFLLIQLGRKDEGRKYIELAKEINPDDDFFRLEVALKLAEVAGEGE